MTCIICHDSTSEPLHNNKYCPCKYEKHASCWIDYVHSKSILTCPICRKEISVKQATPPKPNVPYATRMEPILEEHTQSLTYQEFQDYLSENIITHNRRYITQQRVVQSQPESKWNKITKMVLTLCIIVVIVVVVAVLI